MSNAWIFPGQGSQTVGMGLDLFEVPGASDRLKVAQSVLGWSLHDLTEVELGRTSYTQPALFVVEAILADLLRAAGHGPAAVAGHSLGEYSALYCARVFDFATGVRLVKQRAQLMESTTSGGGMTAVMGFDRDRLAVLCEATAGVTVANDNSPDQVVLSGIPEAIETVLADLQAKRSIPLRVAAAFHSPFMAAAAADFTTVLDEVDFHPPEMPVYSNVTAQPSRDPLELKQNLRRQVTGSVRWRETTLHMAADGIEAVWEIGPGKVLTGLAKRTERSLVRANVATAADVDSLSLAATR